ncbi:hypothetical protein C8J27_11518 [Rhodobacter aestuarii]|uniref:Phage DNA packaging protein, Nu1 subunit of terminase n=2 Tax=Rhodobacter aestuarii TaxID=453582 RepID=A0A1N7QF12_9RHOB|nr:hypothetical protein [Rhodobacter aestuarii]PTV93505.1 hypothetical protein C8J27_11518 [Rhodobacter aestuarii]SIT21452.1 hypothetical protein SAMN05421580_11723 [Rhodobacter aestuarii]
MTLFQTLPDAAPAEMTKSAFAGHIGVSKGRISQMIRDGLPILDNGRVPVEAATAWYHANVRHSAQTAKKSADDLAQVKREREEAHRDLLRLQVEEKAGRLIDRRAAEAAIFERARAERDAHLAWCSRIAPLIATETGCNLATLFAALDREMRAHLEELASLSIEELPNA